MTTENKIPDFITDEVLIQVKQSDLLTFNRHNGGAYIEGYAGDVLDLDYDNIHEQFKLAATRLHVLQVERDRGTAELAALLAQIITTHDNDAAASAQHIATLMIKNGVIQS